MFQHYVFTATSYSERTRAAFDLVLQKGQKQQARDLFRKISEKNIHSVPTALHVKTMESDSVEDLRASDPFFEDMVFCETLDEFMQYLCSDLELTSSDIGQYILSYQDCTKLKLQKLVYLCYEKYLQQTKEKLFTDPVFAFAYGPVSRDLLIRTSDARKENLRWLFLPQYSAESSVIEDCRMSRSADGFQKMEIIHQVLDEYGSLSESELIRLTHRKGGPWHQAYDGSKWKLISDEVILNGPQI